MYNNLLFISCIFGKHFKHVHPSPDNKNSYFFTNNTELKYEIINKGWNYIFVDKDLTDDHLVSSLQSKYIKFLEFLDDFPEFKNREIIIYFDHMEIVSTATVDEIQLLINKNLDKSLIIRQKPYKTNVHQEIEEAIKQNRYAKNMNLTKKFIKNIISTEEFSEDVTVCNTGLLIYTNRHKIRELLKNVYNKCIEHQQPECQIYWSIFSQKYKNEITEIKWTDIKNQRKNPDELFHGLKRIPKYIKARLPTTTIQKIPRNIVQTHEQDLLPDRMVSHMYSWIDKNPTYDYYFFDNNDRINFITEHFDKWVLDMYNQVIPGAIKADIFRLCFIYIKGGVYSDIDQTCINSLDSVIEPDDDIVTGVCRNTPHQMLIISSPNNPIFMHTLESGYKRVITNKPLIGNWGYAGGFLGPAAYTFSWQWFHNNKVEPNINIDDKWLFQYQFKKGKYNHGGFTFNVKDYSLFTEHGINKLEIKLATMKYNGYDQDNERIGSVDYRKLEKNLIEKPKSLEESFDTIYDKKMWTDNNKFTLSGPGSEIRYAKNCITFLTDFIKKKNIRKIIDGSCGDCLWIMEVLKEFPDIEYIGYDISKKIININKEKYKKYSFYQDNLLTFAKIPECDLFIFRHTMMHLSINDNVKFINMLKNNSNCFVFLTHHEIKSNNQGEPHNLNMSSLKWVEKNLHIKPFEIEEYIVDKFRECHHNSNEFGCIYKFNEKKDEKISVLPIKLNLSNEYLETTTDIININNIIKKHTNSVEGNCLYQHRSNFQQFEGKRYDEKKILRDNFFNIAKDAKNLLEIGLNGGHSMAIFFLSNPKLEVLSFDICEHNYVRDVAKYYNNKYNFNFVEGSSLITIKEYKNEKKYDIIHIDGGHSEECVRNDLINCKRFCHKDTLMIFDDTNAVHISKILNEYCEKNFIKEIDYSEDLKKCFFHRIFKYQSV